MFIRFKYFRCSSTYTVHCKSWQDFFNQVTEKYILDLYTASFFKKGTIRYKKVGGNRGYSIEYFVSGIRIKDNRRMNIAKIEVFHY